MTNLTANGPHARSAAAVDERVRQVSAEDVAAEAFTEVFRRWDKIRDPVRVIHYLRSTVLNRSRSMLRRRPVARRHIPHHVPPVWSAESEAVLSEQRRDVLRALRTLPSRRREVLILRFYLEISDAEIARSARTHPGGVPMTSDRSSSGLDARVKDALQAAASTVTAANRPYTAEQLVQRAGPPRWQWPVVSLAAAVAVGLAVAVPYGLLHGSSTKPLPAQSPSQTASALPTLDEPDPLLKVALPPQSPFMISNELGDAGMRAVVQRVANGGATEVEELPGDDFWSATAAPDGHTFYLSRQDKASCDSELVEVILTVAGKVASMKPVPATKVDGASLSNLALSPDGKRMAMTVVPEARAKTSCRPQGRTYDLVVMDLAMGTKRSWSESEGTGMRGTGNRVTWSLDGTRLVFPWPLEWDAPGATVLWSLDVAAPEGGITDTARRVPADESFAKTGRTELRVLTPGGAGMEYPNVLAAYLPQGGSRILAHATNPDTADPPVLVEISLAAGKIRELPR